MPDWSSGYVADIGYTYGAYAELNPLRVKLAFLNAGLVFPESGTACELGFGQGLSTNIHAAASVTEWSGTDFNPAHAGAAQELASASGVNARLYDQAFAEFCTRDDLPEFDFIGLHGIWSWVSDEDRATIVDFARRKLKVGGVLYVSYNVLQGWASMVPVREVMTEFSQVMAATGQHTLSKVDSAVSFMQSLIEQSPAFAAANPTIKNRLEQIKGVNRHYVAHEYFNRNWTPMPFSAMAKWLEPAKLDFACSAHYLDHLDFVHFDEEQRKILQGIDNPSFRQTVRDFMANTQFRKDYWVRGARKLRPVQAQELMLAQRVVMTMRAEDVKLEQTVSSKTITLNREVYQPILDLMANYKVRTVGQIVEHCSSSTSTASQICQAVFILASINVLEAAQDERTIEKAKTQTDKLNRQICTMARDSADIANLASPVTGGQVTVDRFQQLFLLGRAQGGKNAKDWAAFANRCLKENNQRVNVDGKPAESEQQQLAELERVAAMFERDRLTLLVELQVAV